ncbi:hypothetical protein [Nocardioides xinjiangensis]|uniref:hypothetical protein n=1 Tax=Nocardioides xinjiangensis TaxID=2817376 RepID=UPI001B307AFA|nr:hypothetical protein [Nocardioides sp. SYSU D00514]
MGRAHWPDAPEFGGWIDVTGRQVFEVLGTVGPPGVRGIEWYFMPEREHYGKRLVDAVWQYGTGLKVYSERLCEVMEAQGARLETWPADVRHRDGQRIPGYLAVLEEVDTPGPVHSFVKGRRSSDVAINEDVRSAILRGAFAGLEIEEVSGPFPGGDFDDPPAL